MTSRRASRARFARGRILFGRSRPSGCVLWWVSLGGERGKGNLGGEGGGREKGRRRGNWDGEGRGVRGNSSAWFS